MRITHIKRTSANSDVVLEELSSTKFFNGRKLWCELNPVHYKFLILRTFIHLDRLTKDERNDPYNITICSLYFLIGCLLKCISVRTEANVEYLKIRRLTKDILDISYLINSSIDMNNLKEKKPKLKIVVDNDKNS